MNITFPFLGAGKAEYFEYCQIFVKFLAPPDHAARKKIIKEAPLPMKLTSNNFYGSLVVSTTPKYVNLGIQRYYGNENDEIPRGEAKFYCTVKAENAFERAIMKWLRLTHKISPIEVVLRQEDYEAGGTVLSDLHRASVKQIPELLDRWEDPTKFQFDENHRFHVEAFIAGVLFYAENKSVTSYNVVREKFLPFENMQFFLITKDLTKVEALLKTKTHSESYFEKMCDGFINYLCSPQYNEDVVLTVTHWLIDDLRFLNLILYNNTSKNHLILIAAIRKGDLELLGRIRTLIATVPDDHLGRFIGPIYWETFGKLIPEQWWEIAVSLYEFVIDLLKVKSVKYYDLTLYCNALWILQNDNTGLAVNEIMNEKFLEVCLPHGSSYPAVFYNAACLYIEMKDFDKAFDCVQKAVSAGIEGNDYSSMLNDITNNPLCEEFKRRSDVQNFIKTLQASR